jgi:hypothetical protein
MQLKCLPQRTLDRHGHRVLRALSRRDNRPLLDIGMTSAIYCGAQLALLPGRAFPDQRKWAPDGPGRRFVATRRRQDSRRPIPGVAFSRSKVDVVNRVAAFEATDQRVTRSARAPA